MGNTARAQFWCLCDGSECQIDRRLGCRIVAEGSKHREMARNVVLCNINSHLRIQQLQVVLDQKLFYLASGESTFECWGWRRQLSVFDILAHIRWQPCIMCFAVLSTQKSASVSFLGVYSVTGSLNSIFTSPEASVYCTFSEYTTRIDAFLYLRSA